MDIKFCYLSDSLRYNDPYSWDNHKCCGFATDKVVLNVLETIYRIAILVIYSFALVCCSSWHHNFNITKLKPSVKRVLGLLIG